MKDMSTGLPCLATMLFNRPIRVLVLKVGREPININNDDDYYKGLKLRQKSYMKNNDSEKDSTLFSSRSTVAVQMEVPRCIV